MSDCKTPDYRSGRRGRHWTHALRSAEKAGAVIVTDDTGEPVRFAAGGSGPGRFRPWTGPDGHRYDSYEVHPEW
ncbi:hypothetical protein C0216_16735 [Streptomyces globosus]|uniref:Uncharacterized protein n=1 Tax=Streptomyces globosus TaxID=68209 RepID=A0A344U1V8_9ACTN|nr:MULTISPECIES: hypothetical protein [Streptomyces]AXE24879.1 hypothetical protein C0216_16735 [Streptomyces globosus]